MQQIVLLMAVISEWQQYVYNINLIKLFEITWWIKAEDVKQFQRVRGCFYFNWTIKKMREAEERKKARKLSICL